MIIRTQKRHLHKKLRGVMIETSDSKIILVRDKTAKQKIAWLKLDAETDQNLAEYNNEYKTNYKFWRG